MFLRDQDILNLNLSDTFNIQAMHPAARSKLTSGLDFCLKRGKTKKAGMVLTRKRKKKKRDEDFQKQVLVKNAQQQQD
ncbi:hypothetical protein BGZ99_001890 [Dissophora globulifera]|uniref:Uncharacterized protein n=1 Tax=Dissophora globulifera TaxID=979702 RepID=A0A9P6UIP5_9FUNG|nr:hypothetical protein BGZ99_001890 [Dissophora globulifera]